MVNLKIFQASVLSAAHNLVDNATYLPEGNSCVRSHDCNVLGESLVELQRVEAELYSEHFIYAEQQNLNAAQAALHRLSLTEDEINIELALDAADKTVLGLFDSVIIPGYSYSSSPSKESTFQYVETELLETLERALNLIDPLWAYV